jgi:uncharacterized protein (TIGR02266 family)
MRDWRVTVETKTGLAGYGVLIAPSGDRWRSRIVTFPRSLWSVPGGGGTMKFLGRTKAEARRKAVDYVRRHCAERGFLMYDEIEPVNPEPFVVAPAAPKVVVADEPVKPTGPTSDRVRCRLPVRFGRSRPNVNAVTANLSPSGLFVATDYPLAEGQRIDIVLELEHMRVPLRAEVIWMRDDSSQGRPSGMGLRLCSPPAMYISYVSDLC